MSEANGKRRLEPDDLPTTSSSSSHAHACKACSRSKRRCDRKQPCSHCAAKGQPCEQFCDDEGAVKKPRKKRFPEATLLATIKAYEAALTANGIDAEAVKRAASVDESAESTTLDASHPDALEEFDNVQSIVQGESAPNGIQGGKTLAPASSCSLFSLPRDLPNRQAILRHFDEAFEDDAHSLLAFKDHAPGQPLNHPSTFQIFKLWSTYTERVHPVCKILHAPTMQERIFAIGDSLEAKATPTDHALLFAIYFIAAFTLSGAELGAVFGSETDVQTTLLHLAMSTQTALARAGVFKSSNLGVLQAYILYLIPLQRFIDPRTFASFTAIADRTARRIHIHRELRQAKSPLEQEMRRRVWWEVLMLDARAVEKSGAGCGVLASNWNAKLPRPCNDADLVQAGESSSTPHTPGSESFLFAVRCELASFLASLRQRQGLHLGMTELSSVANLSLQDKREAIDGLERTLEQKLLGHCDDVHVLTKLTRCCARFYLSKMRLQAEIAHNQQLNKQQATQTNGVNREARGLHILTLCSDQIRLFTEMRSSPALGATFFEWYWIQQMPFLAFLYSFSLLREHTLGKVVDDCWDAIERCWEMWSFNESISESEQVAEGPTGIQGRKCCLLATGAGGEGKGPFNMLPLKRFSLFANIIKPTWALRRAALARRDGVEVESIPVPPFVQRLLQSREKFAGMPGSTTIESTAAQDVLGGGPLDFVSSQPSAQPAVASTDPPSLDNFDLDSILASFLGGGGGSGGSGSTLTPLSYSDFLPSSSPDDAFGSFLDQPDVDVSHANGWT